MITICEWIEQFNTEVKIVNTDIIIQVGDSIDWMYGLGEVMAGESLKFEKGTTRNALNSKLKNVGVVLMVVIV